MHKQRLIRLYTSKACYIIEFQTHDIIIIITPLFVKQTNNLFNKNLFQILYIFMKDQEIYYFILTSYYFILFNSVQCVLCLFLPIIRSLPNETGSNDYHCNS